MVNQRYCPFCKSAARHGCEHLALAAPGRDFVQRCIDSAQAQLQWRALCSRAHEEAKSTPSFPDHADFTWLETAFCQRFLAQLRWFGSMDYEWRSTEDPEVSGFHVLLWSRHPQWLWWELHDEIDRQLNASHHVPVAGSQRQPDLFLRRNQRLFHNHNLPELQG